MRYLKGMIIIICLCFSIFGCNTTVQRQHKHTKKCKDVFVLDFTGGTSRLWMFERNVFAGIDFSRFDVYPNGTLNDIDNFQEMVRNQIEVILLNADLGINIEIIIEEQKIGHNNIHYGMVSDPTDTKDRITLASAHYDVCNLKHYNYSLLYCKSFADKGPFTVEGWVNYFANLTTHEVAHNLGFGHVDEEEVPDSIYGELMTPTLSDEGGVEEQRILVEQDICPPGTENTTYKEVIIQDGQSGDIKTYMR